MKDLFKIAIRNLARYRRRTLLTASLVSIGVLFVLVFESVSGSFKQMMIAQITDSMLGHMQVHRKGYVASIETLPLTMNMKPQAAEKVEQLLSKDPGVEAFSPRIKFGGMFSNFTETTNVRINGVFPEKEFQTVPLLISRVVKGDKALRKGEILVPELLARGMDVKPGGVVVVIATNQTGSVNGKQLRVAGILSGVTGPGGRDAYVHIEDAAEILRMEEMEISEYAVRVRGFDEVEDVATRLGSTLATGPGPQGKPGLEVHTWQKLSPFANVASMIDVLTVFIRIMLISIVLVSIMNVMIMAVYERVREIGTMAAIGTLPRRILSMFVIEGFALGALGALVGTLVGLVFIALLRLARLEYNFGQQQGLVLRPAIELQDVIIVSVIVIVVSIVASLQPALHASRLEPVKALRHV